MKNIFKMNADLLSEIHLSTENEFVRRFISLENKNKRDFLHNKNTVSEDELRDLYRNVKTARHKANHLFFSLRNIAGTESPEKIGLADDTFFADIASYSDIFNELTASDNELDLFSPAAYFAELLWVIEKYITGVFFGEKADEKFKEHSFFSRRPDLKILGLTKENCDKTIPYTQIANERLEEILEKTTDELIKDCANFVYPPPLPYNIPYVTVVNSLTINGFTPSSLYKTFTNSICEENLSALSLMITADYFTALMDPGDDFYHDLDFNTVKTEDVIKTTGLNRSELIFLLERGIDNPETLNRVAGNFFINRQSGVITFSDEIIKGLTKDNIADFIKFIRFAKITGLSFDQLDAIIFGDQKIIPAVSLFAKIKSEKADLLPLISRLYDYGLAATFPAVFGNDLDLNSSYRFKSIIGQLSLSLNITMNDVKSLWHTLFDTDDEFTAIHFNAFYRNAYFANLLRLSIDEYIVLLKVANISSPEIVGVFSEQIIFSLLSYKELYDTSVYEADFICNGAISPYVSAGFSHKDFERFIEDVKSQVLRNSSSEARRLIVEKNICDFLKITDQTLETLQKIIPPAPKKFSSWQEAFYEGEEQDFALNVLIRLARFNLLTSKIPLDIFNLFFAETLEENIKFNSLVDLFKIAKFYLLNPAFFVLAAKAIQDNDIKNLSFLCGIPESDIEKLLDSSEFTLSNVYKFVTRLDAVKSLDTEVSDLAASLDALTGTGADAYDKLVEISKNMPAPPDSKTMFTGLITALAVHKKSEVYKDINSPEALSDYLLLDLQTDETVQISYIREGINAALTYLNRCRLGLEPGVGRTDLSEEHWSFIMNYSEWKANRMIYVNPENYLLPDIRSSQSELFKKAMQNIAGRPLDLKAAEQLLSEYLDDFAHISEIIPCASYLASTDESEQLYVFGHTPLGSTESQGGGFHYCIRENEIWGEWIKIPAPIPLTEITPIFIFGKLYIFWLEISETNAPDITVETSVEAEIPSTLSLTQNTADLTRYTVKYTFRNLSGKWSNIQTLFDDAFLLDRDDLGKQFENAYNKETDGYKRLSLFRITENNFLDSYGTYQCSNIEKLLLMFGGFTYSFSNESIEDYYPSDKPFDGKESSSFSAKHASLADKINILTNRNISGRLCSGHVRIFGSSMREEHLVAKGEFFIFDEYVGGAKAVTPTVTADESSSMILSTLTSDVLKNSLFHAEKVMPKIAGLISPEFEVELEPVKAKDKQEFRYTGEFSDTLNTFILGSENGDVAKTLDKFQEYLKDAGIAPMPKKPASKSDDKPDNTLIHLNPQSLSLSSFYSTSYNYGILPEQFSDMYNILLQCLGSKRLFGTPENRVATDSEIIKTANLADGFILKTYGIGSEVFLIIPESESGKLIPTDKSLKISYPKITYANINEIIGIPEAITTVFNALVENAILDVYGFVLTSNLSEENINDAIGYILENYNVENIPLCISNLYSLFANNRYATNYMFWSQNIDKKLSDSIFNALSSLCPNKLPGESMFESFRINATDVLGINPKVKLRGTDLVGTKTAQDLSLIFSQYVSASMPVSIRYQSEKPQTFDLSKIKYRLTRLTNPSLPFIIPEFSAGGVDAFLKLKNQQAPIPVVLPISRFSPNDDTVNIPEALDAAQPDFDSLYKNYNYELFYHIPMYAAKTLKDFGNYEGAKKWLEYIYSPLAAESFITDELLFSLLGNKTQKGVTILTDSLHALLKEVGENKVPPGGSFDESGVNYRVINFSNNEIKNTVKSQLYLNDFTQEESDNLFALLSNYSLGGQYSYCWQFYPFRARTIQKLKDDLVKSNALLNYRNNPFDPHAIASLRIGAYEKYTVLEYVDILIEWGDREFSKLTWDGIANATSLYNTAKAVLGEKPLKATPAKKQEAMSFKDLLETKSADKNIPDVLNHLTLLLLNNDSVDLSNLPDTEFFLNYFKIPANAMSLTKWDIVDDRLNKIRKNLDINGNKRCIPLYPAAVDPLRLAAERNSAYSSPGAATLVDDSYYRYLVLYSSAKEFGQTLVQFSNSLLLAIEKGDNEALLLMATKQNSELLDYAGFIRKNTIKELEYENISLLKSIESADARIEHYTKLIADNISGAETAAIAQNISAGVLNLASTAYATGAGVSALVPQAGSPFAMTYGGQQLAGSLAHFSMAAMSAAATLNMSSGVTATYAEYERRLNEWELQLKLANHESEMLNASLEINNIRRQSALYEQITTDILCEHTADLLEFHKTKFSSGNLFGTLVNLLRRMVFDSYKTVLELASRAEKAWQEELCQEKSFLTYTYWDESKYGLLAGEALLSSLEAMHTAYLAYNPRQRHEIIKTISLKDTFSDEYKTLIESNKCTFTLPLSLFDNVDSCESLRYSSHMIRTVSVNTQVIIGAYQNISGTLTQLGSVILKRCVNQSEFEKAFDFVNNYSPGQASEPEGVWMNRRSGQSISLSNPQNESGLHFYNPHSESLNPFENTGAVSTWELEYFGDYDINDVIINVAYTAIPKGTVK